MTKEEKAQSKRSWIIGLICVLFAQFLFGTTFSLNKYVIQQGVDPILLGFNRTCIAIVCLFPFYWGRRNTTVWTLKDWRLVILVGVFATAGAIILEYTGAKHTTASNVSLIMSIESLLTIYMAFLILKERLHPPVIYGGLGALVGMFFVMWDDFNSVEIHANKALFGDFLVLASVLCWCAFTISSKRIVKRSNPLVAHFFITVFACLSLGSVVAIQGTWRAWMEMDRISWYITIYLGSFCSGLGYLLFFQALKRLPASVVSLTLSLLPLFGVLFSILLLGEKLTYYQILGGAVIIIGVGYALRPQNNGHSIPGEVPPGL
jgi:drug/metabolite transporter (DMT)-like permease